MTDLKTTFAGLSLRNPIIISSSGLTNSVGKNKKLAENTVRRTDHAGSGPTERSGFLSGSK